MVDDRRVHLDGVRINVIKRRVQRHRIQQAVFTRYDHGIGVPVKQGGAVKGAVGRILGLLLGLAAVEEHQFLLVDQAVYMQADGAGLAAGHLGNALAHRQHRAALRIQGDGALERVLDIDRLAGGDAVVEVKEVDLAVLPADDDFLEGLYILLGLRDVHHLAQLHGPLDDGGLACPAKAPERAFVRPQAAQGGFPQDGHLLQGHIRRAEGRVAAEGIAAEGEDAAFIADIAAGAGHIKRQAALQLSHPLGFIVYIILDLEYGGQGRLVGLHRKHRHGGRRGITSGLRGVGSLLGLGRDLIPLALGRGITCQAISRFGRLRGLIPFTVVGNQVSQEDRFTGRLGQLRGR